VRERRILHDPYIGLGSWLCLRDDLCGLRGLGGLIQANLTVGLKHVVRERRISLLPGGKKALPRAIGLCELLLANLAERACVRVTVGARVAVVPEDELLERRWIVWPKPQLPVGRVDLLLA
jgi:hypothetical protein